MKELIESILRCDICSADLPLGPRPVLTAGVRSKIAIVGQAPGRAVHGSGVAWNDPSGRNLRKWLDIDESIFYDTNYISLIPMGFCYPGKGKSGDLPPRTECAPTWHRKLFDSIETLEMIVLVGQYAQNYYLGKKCKPTLTETVMNYTEYLPEYFVLPHPSPRNNIWMARNPWFGENVLPQLKKSVSETLELS